MSSTFIQICQLTPTFYVKNTHVKYKTLLPECAIVRALGVHSYSVNRLSINILPPKTFFNRVVSGGIIYIAKSKDDIILIETWKYSRVSRYNTGLTYLYFDHNREGRLVILCVIGLWGLFLYIFVGPTKKKSIFFCCFTKDKIWSSHFRHHF